MMGILDRLVRKQEKSPDAARWSAAMGWRRVVYQENDDVLWLSIEPMAAGADLVYVPDAEAWRRSAPGWAQSRREEILQRLKEVRWNRVIEWREGASFVISGIPEPVPGSLESTPGGQTLEAARFFNPGGQLTHEQAHQVWHRAAERFAQAAKGKVTIFLTDIVEGSVFQVVELPALRSNPAVTLEFGQISRGLPRRNRRARSSSSILHRMI